MAFYGDDLTGSTDALEFISGAGARSVLFLDPPTEDQLKKYPDIQAYGIAGLTRSLPPESMEEHLLPAFHTMRQTGARHVHYKVCSTFDSSPRIGSIGRAIECGAEVFRNAFVPVLGGTPALGRYCVFGNLFARMGTGNEGALYRLDRHPSMSRHPVTPARESDLRIHLGQQTQMKIGSIDITVMEKDIHYWNEMIHKDEKIVVLDGLHEEQMSRTGEWLDAQYTEGTPLFSVGSSAVEMALGRFWNHTGLLCAPRLQKKIMQARPLLVVSGSCSPVTAAQIELAVASGFEEMVMDARAEGPDNSEDEYLTEKAISFLCAGKDVIVHAGNKESDPVPAERLGRRLGALARQAIVRAQVKRVVVAGGDTSSYAAREMGIEAVQMEAALVPGAPLCKAISVNKDIHGTEVNFKGGQVGSKNYFVVLREGSEGLKK